MLTSKTTASRIGVFDAANEPTDRNNLCGLVSELNSLIAQNAEGIKRARGHVSNLSHALNTLLAAWCRGPEIEKEAETACNFY